VYAGESAASALSGSRLRGDHSVWCASVRSGARPPEAWVRGDRAQVAERANREDLALSQPLETTVL